MNRKESRLTGCVILATVFVRRWSYVSNVLTTSLKLLKASIADDGPSIVAITPGVLRISVMREIISLGERAIIVQ